MKKLGTLIAAMCMASLPFAGQSIGASGDSTGSNARTPTSPATQVPLSWITVAPANPNVAPWVKDIERELMKAQYRPLWSNDPRSPQVSMMYLLNDAADAQTAQNEAVAKDLVRRALNVLGEGIARGYYSQSDIDPIVTYIKTHAPVRLS
jgi:hypothetical protein